MKLAALVLSTLFVIATASPAHAQFGLGKIKSIADKAANVYDDYNITDKEERQIGEQVSLKLRDHFGVYQDAAVTKYVSLVGTALAKGSSRPNLEWQFIVLDTDGVNAYAAPGGIVHITRGLLGLMKSEYELAGVLGHEITHVTAKHSVNAIKKSKGEGIAIEKATSGADMRTQYLLGYATKVADKIYQGEFSREDENEADEVGTRLADKLGYSPAGMLDVLKKIDARNSGREDRNGLFASHPATKDRIDRLQKQIADEKLTGKATAEARYTSNITFDAKPASEITMDVAGAAGLASGDKKKDDDKDKNADDKDKKTDEPKKKGSGLSSITGNKQAQNSQQASSAGARGGLPDRDAIGGPNKNALTVKITAAELDAFKKGIVA